VHENFRPAYITKTIRRRLWVRAAARHAQRAYTRRLGKPETDRRFGPFSSDPL